MAASLYNSYCEMRLCVRSLRCGIGSTKCTVANAMVESDYNNIVHTKIPIDTYVGDDHVSFAT